jgi:hypothetical protein
MRISATDDGVYTFKVSLLLKSPLQSTTELKLLDEPLVFGYFGREEPIVMPKP